MKTEVYSWRVSTEMKTDLERVARRRRIPVSSVLDEAVREWLARNAADVAADEEQKRLHAAAERSIGIFSSGDPNRPKSVRETIRKRLAKKYARRYAD